MELHTENREPKTIISGADALASAVRASSLMNDVVGSTMGPGGQTVSLPRKYLPPIVTKDGVTVAKHISIKHPHDNNALLQIKEAADEVNEAAGDGTTTTVVLLHSLLENGVKEIGGGRNVTQFARGMEHAAGKAIARLESLAMDVADKRDSLHSVALCSSNNDHSLADIVFEAVDKAGEGGIVTVEESVENRVRVEVVDGLRYDAGVISEVFYTDPVRRHMVMENPLVVVVDGSLPSDQWVELVCKHAIEMGRPVAFIAGEFSQSAITNIVGLCRAGQLMAGLIKTPGAFEMKSEMVKDLAVYTGARVVEMDGDFDPEYFNIPQWVGSAERITTNTKQTTVVNGGGDADEIHGRREAIRAQLDEAETQWASETLGTRLGWLSGGLSRILVGAETEGERKEIEDRCEDAKNAVMAAIKKGVLPGAGVSMLSASEAVETEMSAGDWDSGSDFFAGMRAVRLALQAPFVRVMQQADLEPAIKMLEYREARKSDDASTYNILSDEWGSAFKLGVLVPALVETTAVSKAVSTAKTMLRTGHVLAFDTTDEE